MQTPDATMNTPDNIECFSLATRAVLRRLLDSFPRPVRMRSLELQEEMVALVELPASCAWKEGSGCLVDSTLEYLAAEGVIRYREKAKPSVVSDGMLCPVYVWEDVTLTAKGFSVLNRPFPEASTAAGNTFAKAIRGAGSVIGKSTVTETIRMLFQSL